MKKKVLNSGERSFFLLKCETTIDEDDNLELTEKRKSSDVEGLTTPNIFL